jgi:hypothetical protein
MTVSGAGTSPQNLCVSHAAGAAGIATSHSWQFGDPAFTEDLAQTLNGNVDRAVITTRETIAVNRFTLRSLHLLARISQRGRCIGALDLRKSCCENGLSRRQGNPDADRV